MLHIASSLLELDFDKLVGVYGYNYRQTEEFEDYLRQVFFRTEGARYCIWVQEGDYVSALRLEPYQDGLVLAGLETHLDCRGKGFATALVQAALEWLGGMGGVKVYSHIRRRNRASIAVHQRCGFQKIAEHARFLDGSVSSGACTYVLEIKQVP